MNKCQIHLSLLYGVYAVLLSIFPITAYTASPDQLDFEAGQTSDGLPDGWAKGKKTNKNLEFEWVTENHKGSKAIRLLGRGRMKLEVQFKPDTVYSIGYWIKGDEVSKSSRMGLSYRINKLNGFKGVQVLPFKGPTQGWQFHYKILSPKHKYSHFHEILLYSL